MAKGTSLPESEMEGEFTADFLFSFGATCLERSVICLYSLPLSLYLVIRFCA